MALSGLAGAKALLNRVLRGVRNHQFALGIEIKNITGYDLTLTPGYPFFPYPGNMKGEIQCGQTVTSLWSCLGAAPPIRISSPTYSKTTDVGAFSGFGRGLDANIGCISYQAVGVHHDPLFTFVLGWFMGGPNLVKYAFAPNANGEAYERFGNELFANTTSGFSTRNCNFTHYWTDVSQKTKLNVTINNKSETFQFIVSSGGDVKKYHIVLEVRQIGYTIPS